MSAIGKELRSAVRSLWQSPVFSGFALLSIALGLAANIAIFSIVDGVLLRPLAFTEPGRLFGVFEVVPKLVKLYPVLPVNPRHADYWRKMVPGIETLGLARNRNVVLGSAVGAVQVPGEVVSPDLLSALKLHPLIGRLIKASDAQEGHDHVAVLTYALWLSRFGSDRNIVGRDIRVDGVPYQVIGVLPPDFRYPLTGSKFDSALQPEVLLPLWFRLSDVDLEGDFNFSAIVRLKPGVRRETALAALNTAQASLSKTLKNGLEVRADLLPLNDVAVQSSRASLLLVFGAVGAVLLIICLNIATLMLARGTLKNREIAVRTALGASRWRLIREALMESIVLSAGGGMLGLVLAELSFKAILSGAPATLPRRSDLSVDAHALLFALGLLVLTILACGFYPAWKQSRRDPQEALAASSRSSTSSRSGALGRSMLVAVEVGLSTVLLALGGLLLASFSRLMNTNVGFEIAHHVSAQLSLPGASYKKPEDVVAFYDNLLPELSNRPGIRQAALISQLPLHGEIWVDIMSRQDDKRPLFEKPTTNLRFVSPSYFEAMGIPLVDGRTFTLSDRKGSAVVISAAVARTLWPRENPVGQMLLLEDKSMRVVGVAGDTRADLDKSAPSVVYVPYWDHSRGMENNLTVAMRISIPAGDAITVLRRAVSKLDPGIPISHIETFDEVLSDAAAQRRFQMLLVGGFAVSALLIAALGIFGVVAGVVSARRNEIGIRMALGASTGGVVAMVMRQGMTPVLSGLGAGLAATLGLSSVIRNLLYQVQPADPSIFVAVVLLLGGVAAFACWVPARRAVRIDPMEALRYE